MSSLQVSRPTRTRRAERGLPSDALSSAGDRRSGIAWRGHWRSAMHLPWKSSKGGVGEADAAGRNQRGKRRLGAKLPSIFVRKESATRRVLALLCAALVVQLPVLPAMGQVITTPTVPAELPVEIETELGPGSLKQAPLWKELVQLLESPYSPVVRRPGFGAFMPPLNVIPLGHNFLSDQPLRLRTSDGEVSWDQPGPLFDPAQTVASLDTDGNGVPDVLRTRIGALVASEDEILDQADLDRLDAMTSPDPVTGGVPLCPTCGYLIVSNPTGH